ncbi:hypothetical protein [Actinomadura livida]|uniref:Uncharacterized protein n=1 Tax=Actinomadura livida TaxID=79909 RepID=A0A7W7IJZ1_9ACTN|nr:MULTISPECIES: hypothetical protein [Actinomadura]MBB4778494.1 hypothetical protein [Actinomadura catellatispora]GGU24127.1 hypothetical protein GCM10010208_56200 [Actinomadura livida]
MQLQRAYLPDGQPAVTGGGKPLIEGLDEFNTREIFTDANAFRWFSPGWTAGTRRRSPRSKPGSKTWPAASARTRSAGEPGGADPGTRSRAAEIAADLQAEQVRLRELQETARVRLTMRHDREKYLVDREVTITSESWM